MNLRTVFGTFISAAALSSVLVIALHCIVLAGSGEVRSGGSFNVGYTVLDFPHHSGKQNKTLTVAVWYPTESAPAHHDYGGKAKGIVALNAPPYQAGGPYPFLLFSHGFGGSGLAHRFLAEKLAARGWIVAAPDHGDRYSAFRIRTGPNNDLDRPGFLIEARKIGLSGPDQRGKYEYRLDELKAVLDGMLESSPFKMLINRNQIAVGGHSLGGFTALGLCGPVEERRDARIKAVLLFSTGAGGYLFRENELDRLKIPYLYFLGEREEGQKRGDRTMKELAEKVFLRAAPPKYLVVLKGGGHFSFNEALIGQAGLGRFWGQ